MNISKIKNILFSIAILLCFIGVSVEAQELTQQEKTLKTTISQNNYKNLSNEYLQNVENLFYKQLENLDYKNAINTINYFVEANKKFYGENEISTAYAYVERANFFATILKNPDENFKNHLIKCYTSYFLTIDEPYSALTNINKLTNNKDNFLDEYSRIYSQMKDIKKAQNIEKQIYKNSIQNAENKNIIEFNNYFNLANIEMTRQNYQNCIKYLEKAEKLLATINDEDNQQKINFNFTKIRVYNNLYYFDEELKLLKDTEKLTNQTNNLFAKEEILQLYLDFYRESKDFTKALEYKNKIAEFYKNLPANSFGDLRLQEKIIDIYKDSEDYISAASYVNKLLEKLSTTKNFNHALYGKFLNKKQEILKNENKTDEAEKLIDEAYKEYQYVADLNSYYFYDVYKNYGDLWSKTPDERITYYTKALEINNAFLGEINDDAADILANLAELQDNKTTALYYINKSIETYKKVYDENNVKVYDTMLRKFYIYERFELNKKADKLLNEINSAVENNKIKGENAAFYFNLNISNAYKSLQDGNIQDATKYATKAENYIKVKSEHTTLNDLKENIKNR
jgi:tetratricopeptide (TPR) repeat protein